MATAGYHVTALDVRPLGFEHPYVEPIRASIYDWSPSHAFEAVTAISVVEHLGLGRYGDQVLEQGDVVAMRIIRSWLRRMECSSFLFRLGHGLSLPSIGSTMLLRLSGSQGYEAIEDDYFDRHGEAWLPCQAQDLAQAASPQLPMNGVVVRKLSQQVRCAPPELACLGNLSTRRIISLATTHQNDRRSSMDSPGSGMLSRFAKRPESGFLPARSTA